MIMLKMQSKNKHKSFSRRLRKSKRYIKFFLFMAIFLASNFSFLLPDISKTQVGKNIVDKIYLAKQNPNVVDNFRPREVQAAEDPAQLEYHVDIGPVTGSASANYVYGSFFNPNASGRTMVIKRIAVRANAVAAANYVNLSVNRISAASLGTQITTANIPKKNNDSSASIAEVRHTGPTVTRVGTVDTRIMGQPMSGAAGQYYSYRDIALGANDEKIVLQPNEGIDLIQEAAGDADQRIRFYVEWEEVASAPSAQGEFLFAFPRVEVAATANYVYNSFFNPAASGKSAVVKRVWFGSETCDTTAVYTNNISLRRTTAASGGTAITATNVPKKNTSGANSVMDFRRTGVTNTLVGTVDARLGLVTPCGAAGQASGWQQIDFQANDEKLILQQGEGIALISEATGDIDQLVRMVVEWQEVAVASTPASQGEYLFAYPRVTAPTTAPPANTTFYTFFNPIGSGKTAVVKRLGIRSNAGAAATYTAFTWKRMTAAPTGGTAITNTNVPKKHTGTATTAMGMLYCATGCTTAITATYISATDSRLLSVNGAGAVGQIIGQRETVFADNEKLVLQPGEGIGFYTEALGSIGHYTKAFVEWDEEASTPSALGEYQLEAGPINGSATSGYNYVSFFNPAASGKTTIIKKASIRVDWAAASQATSMPITLRRTTTSRTGVGTQITAANVPKKHTGSANTAMDIWRTGPTGVTYAGGADSRLTSVQPPSAAGSATAASTSGYKEFAFVDDEDIVLQPGEGVGLYQETANTGTGLRIKFLLEWQEVASGSTPASQGEYLMSTGPVSGSLNANYVYSSLLNPAGSGKTYVVKRIEIRTNRTGTAVAPSYIPATIRRTTTASGGTAVTQANVPKKHSGTGTTTAQINHTGPSVTFAGEINSRLLGVTVPGAVNQYADYENKIVYGDELILKEGEGIALYQEATSGDALQQFRMAVEWSEVSAATNSAPTLSISQPDGVSDTVAVGQSYNIIYDLADTDDVVTAAFYYDTNATGLDGTDIIGACASAAEGTGVTCAWDTTGMTPGSYYVYGMTNDGTNPAVSDYSAGTITIQASNQNPNSPLSLTQGVTESAWTTDNTPNLGLTISDNDVGDTVKYQVQIADNSSFTTPAIDYTHGSTSANPTVFTFTVGSYGAGTCTGSCPSTLPDLTAGYWWRVKAIDNNGAPSGWVEFGVAGTMDMKVDATAPTGGTVKDGQISGGDLDWNSDGSLTSLLANWTGTEPSSGVSGVQKYEYALRRQSDGWYWSGSAWQSGESWTNNSTGTSFTKSSMNLQTGVIYYISLKTTDNAGNIETISSNGLRVTPTLSFSLDSNTVDFSNLSNANNWTDTKTTTFTSSTNASNGYTIQGFINQLLTNPYSGTISNFLGTWSTPQNWTNLCKDDADDCGFGYTSSDTSVQGLNRFSAGNLFAAFSQTGPGNVLADHTSAVNGSTGAVSNEEFILTHKVSVPTSQAASKYQTTLTVIMTANY